MEARVNLIVMSGDLGYDLDLYKLMKETNSYYNPERASMLVAMINGRKVLIFPKGKVVFNLSYTKKSKSEIEQILVDIENQKQTIMAFCEKYKVIFNENRS